MFSAEWSVALCLVSVLGGPPAPVSASNGPLAVAVEARPKLFSALYGSYIALQAADVGSSFAAVRRGRREVNPIAASLMAEPGALVAVKAISTAATIYFVERARRKSRKAAIGAMLALNGATAAIVAHNVRRTPRSR